MSPDISKYSRIPTGQIIEFIKLVLENQMGYVISDMVLRVFQLFTEAISHNIYDGLINILIIGCCSIIVKNDSDIEFEFANYRKKYGREIVDLEIKLMLLYYECYPLKQTFAEKAYLKIGEKYYNRVMERVLDKYLFTALVGEYDDEHIVKQCLEDYKREMTRSSAEGLIAAGRLEVYGDGFEEDEDDIEYYPEWTPVKNNNYDYDLPQAITP